MRHYFLSQKVHSVAAFSIRKPFIFGKSEYFLEESLYFGEGVVELVDGEDSTGVSNLLLGAQFGVVVQEKQVLLDLLVLARLDQMQKVGLHLFTHLLCLVPLRMEFNQFLCVRQLYLSPRFLYLFRRVFVFHYFHGDFVLRVQRLEIEGVIRAWTRIYQRI